MNPVFALLSASLLLAIPAGTKEDATFRELGTAYVAAWERSDANALAAFFTEDGDLIIPTGLAVHGRGAIEGFYRQVFQSGYAGSKASFELQQLRVIDGKTALIDFTWSIAGGHDADGAVRPVECGISTAVAVKTAKGWRVAALREQTSAKAITPQS